MKLKEKYIRLNYAKEELFKTIEAEKLPSVQCTNKLIERILKQYNDWSMTENMYCCHGWKTNCWQEFYAEGVWDMTYAQVIETLKDILTSIRHESRKLPILHIIETNDDIKILVSQRHKNFYERSDWIIFGKKRKSN